MFGFWKRMSDTGRTATLATAVVAVMASLGWAAVPLYDLFCRVTGYGGTTQTAESAGDVILDRTIRVRFDASVTRGFPWEFRPVERVMELRIGETGIAYYEAHNPTDQPISGSASYNVTPYSAGPYFIKIACFCFTEQVIQPGETIQMPVTFYVDPEIVTDPDAMDTHTITLSYTFYPTQGEDLAALDTNQPFVATN